MVFAGILACQQLTLESLKWMLESMGSFGLYFDLSVDVKSVIVGCTSSVHMLVLFRTVTKLLTCCFDVVKRGDKSVSGC